MSDSQNSLKPLDRFIGGQWKAEGTWLSGAPLKARIIYEWGIAEKIIRKYVYSTEEGVEFQRYEGILFWNKNKNKLQTTTFTFQGDHQTCDLLAEDEDHIIIPPYPFPGGTGGLIKETLTFVNDDECHWEVFKQDGDSWVKLMETSWFREEL